MTTRGNVRRSAARRRTVVFRLSLLLAAGCGIAWFALTKFNPELLDKLTAGFRSEQHESPKLEAPARPVIKKATAERQEKPLVAVPTVTTDESPPDPYEEFERFARANPRTAAAQVATLQEGEDRDNKLAILLDVWSENSPGAAADWVNGLPGSEFQGEAAEYLALHWAMRDPLGAAAWVESNIQSGRKPSGAAVLAATWAASDSKAAMEWADKLEDPDARWQSYGAIGNQLGIDNPQNAVEWLNNTDDLRLRDAIATGLISSWSHKDPAAAAAWLKGDFGPDGEAIRFKASFILVNQWTADDAYAASFWVNSLPAGELKEGVKVSLAKSLSVDAPEDALVWAKAINDPEQRDDTVLTIYEDWIDDNPDDFKQGLIREWPTIKDPEFRKNIYDLLYDYDPSFKEEVYQLLEDAINPAAEEEATLVE